MDDITIIAQSCFECGDALADPPATDATPRCAGGCPNPVRSCDACGGNFKPIAPPDGQPLYELHGCKDGKVRAKLDNPTCSHCGAAKAGVGAVCGCPGDTAKRKADDDTLAAKWALDRQHMESQRKAQQARTKSATVSDLAGLRRGSQRDRQDAELVDRERTVKERELSRRERRQDGYDAQDAEATEPAAVEPDWDTFDAMRMDVVRSTIGKLPAILSRTDGRTILYAQKVNTIAARPNGGKSWLAIKCAVEVVERGGRVLMLDFDNKRPSVLAGRAQDMAVEDTIQNKEYFHFSDVELVKHKGARAAAIQWLLAAKNPVFSTVIIDSDTAAGVPTDGADALPWWKVHVNPWETAEIGVLVLSHRGKDDADDDEPSPGPMGPTSKRALPTGAVLIMKTTKMWNSEVGGLVHLRVDKDRNGELPGVETETIVDMVVEHEELDGKRFLNITLEPPDSERGNDGVVNELDAALANYPDGVYSQKAVRALVKGNGKTISIALKTLIDGGYVVTEKVEGKKGFIYKSAMFKD